MYITGIGTATPPHRYLQTDCWQAASVSPEIARLRPASRAILKKVLLGKNGIVSRYLALNSLEEVFENSPDTLHARYLAHAPALATQAAQRALSRAGAGPEEIDAVIISTCTGYLCPGLTSYVSAMLGLKDSVLALDLVGQGCGAALPNLQTAEALIKAGGHRKVLSICVEVCSAAFYLDDDPGVLISACLFGDAAGAAVLEGAPRDNGRRMEWQASGSILEPGARDILRFETKGGLLRNVLTPQVPAMAAQHAGTVLERVLGERNVAPQEIRAWILHAGGRDVLWALQKRLNLREADLEWSAGVLRETGNVSSPFVLHVLEAAVANNAPGGYWWMSAFGAGFSCHGALLKVE